MHAKEWDLLIAAGAGALPIRISDICHACGTIAISYDDGEEFLRENSLDEYTESDAFTTKIQGRYVIFYRGGAVVEDMRAAIMHEIAHLVLGHLSVESSAFDGVATLWNRVSAKEPDVIEEAATAFAASVLAPACVLWALKISRAVDIEKLCAVTKKLARKRAERMAELYEREKEFIAYKGKSCFLQSERERVVYRNFSDYINKNKPKKKKRGIRREED